MATYAFKALDRGRADQGRDRGIDKQTVASQLRRGLIVVDIEQTPANAGDLLARFAKIKPDDLVIATRQLSTMVSSGMSLLRALYVIEEQTESDKLREVWIEVRKDVEAGVALSDAPQRHPEAFNELYVAMVQAGETGILDQTLVRVAEQLEKDAALRRQIKAAMVYPSLIGGFAFVVLFALVTFLVPRVREDLQGLRRRAAGHHQVHGVAVAHVHAALVRDVRGHLRRGLAVPRWKRSERGRMQWDTLKLKFPMKIGDIVQKVALARFSRTFSG